MDAYVVQLIEVIKHIEVLGGVISYKTLVEAQFR